MSTVAVGCLIATVAVVAPTAAPVTAAPTLSGTISGAGYGGATKSGVFRDINANGVWNTGEPGQGDIVVTATCVSETGASSSSFDDQYVTASTTTADDGSYTLTGANVRGLCRVEFAIPANLQSVLQPGVASTAVASPNSAGSFVQFVDSTLNPTVTTAVMNPADYTNATGTPDLALSLQSTGSSNATTNPDAATSMAVTRFVYGSSGTVPANTNLANFDDVGAVWGLAVQPSTATVFAASVVKRHAGVGPSGVDAIYALGSSVPAAWATPFTAVDADGGTIPNDATRGITDDGSPSVDLTVFAEAGKQGWGDIDTSEDGTTLYAVNLHDKKIYAIDIATKTSSTSFTIPTPVCTNGNARPWGMAVHDGIIYAGVICDAATGSAANLAAFVYAYNPSSGALPVAGLASDLAAGSWSANLVEEATPGAAGIQLDYVKGCTLGTNLCAWQTWKDTFAGNFTPPSDTWASSRPQPLLSDIAFDDDGSMILDFADRSGLQFGYRNDCANDGTADTNCESVTGGDLLRAGVPSGTGSFTLENNGTVARGAALGGGTITGAANGQGPGTGEVYSHESYSTLHEETSIGGLVKVPGRTEFVLTVMDPLDTDSNGTTHFPTDGSARNTTAEWADSTGLSAHGFGKGSGLGDLEMISNLAPVEIGNRVWRDDNDNGLQDPNEPGLAGVEVELVVGANTYTATTDGTGQYLFSSIVRSGATTAAALDPANYRLDAADDAATLRILNVSGGSQQSALVGMIPSEANDATANEANNAGNNANDSDGVVNGTSVEVTFTLGSLSGTNDANSAAGDSVDREGHHRHIFDFGFVPRVSLGNRVWFDTDNDSSMDGAEVGVAGVAVELFYDADANGTIDVGEETPVAYDTTGATGLYFFDQFTDAAGLPLATPRLLTPGNYVVGIAASNLSSGPLVGYLSSAITIANDGVISETTAPDPDDNVNADDNGTMVPSGFYAGGVMSHPVAVTYGSEPTTEDPGFDNNDNDLVRDFASNLTVDFGFYRQSVGNVVWFDNGAGGGTPDNGVLDGTEPATSVAALYLYSGDGTTQILVGADGVLGTADDGTDPVTFVGNAYLFSGLPEGTYVVKADLPTGYRSSTDAATTGTPLGTDSDDNGQTAGTGLVSSAAFTLTPGDLANGGTANNLTGTSQNLQVDFGIVPSEYDLTITKTITSSGAYVAGSSVTFEIVAANNGPGLTDDGFMVVDRLPAGLTFDAPAVTGDSNWSCAVPVGQEVTCTWVGPTPGLGNDVLGVDSVSALTIHAIVDTPAPDPLDDVINFTKVVPSTSMSEPETNLLGTDNDGFETGDPTVDSNNDDSALLNTTPVYSLGDLVWIDSNADGIYDPATELPIEGVTVALLDSGGIDAAVDAYGNTVAPVNTDADGRYSFEGLFADDYVVRFTLPSGYVWTIDGAGSDDSLDSDGTYSSNDDQYAYANVDLSVLAATDNDPDGLPVNDPTYDAGVVLVLSLGDLVWVDTDMDGVYDVGSESPLEGVDVHLLDGNGDPADDAQGNPVGTATTDPDGRYSFDNLLAGTYQVQFDLPAGYIWTSSNGGVDDSLDNDALFAATDDATATTASVVLTTTAVPDNDPDGLSLTNPTLDAGVVRLVSIGDLVWVDTDRDGVFNNGEVGIADVTVSLLDGNGDQATDSQGDPVVPVLTGPDGRYQFDNLLSGDYEVVFTLPAGYIWTLANQGADDGLDSDADAATPTSSTASTGVFTVLAPVTDTDLSDDARTVTDPTRDAGLVVIVYDLALAKIADVTGTGEDTVVDFAITVANQGTVASREFSVLDHLPDGLLIDVSSISDGGVYDEADGLIGWTISDLAPGETLELTFSATVGEFTLRPYRNIAEIDSDSAGTYGLDPFSDPITDADSTPDGTTTNDGDYGPIFDAGDIDNLLITDAGAGADPEDDADIADFTVELTYDLALAKTPSETTINPDGSVTFTVTVENQGDVNSGDYTITDTLPAGTLATEASNGGVITGTTVTWDLTDLAPGDAQQVSVTVVVTDITLRPFKNIAEISADGADTYDAADDTYPGFDVEDVDSFPDAATDQDNGDLPDGDDGYGTFENPENDIDDIADVDSTPNGEDDADVAFFDAPVLYDLALIKTGPAAIIGNGTATFTITIQNQGNVDSGDFTVVDAIPNGLIAIAASGGGVIADPFVTWELTGLAPGATTSVTVTVQVINFDYRPWVNEAEITSDGADDYDTEGYENPSDGDVEDDDSVPDSDRENDELVDQTLLPTDQFNDPTVDEDDHDVAPITVDIDYDLALVKSLPAGQSFKAGQPIVFNIVVKNQGNVDSGPITVQDVVPAGLGIVTASDGGLGVGQVVTWEIANLTPGQTRTLTITVTVVNTTLSSYVNFAEIVADGTNDYGQLGEQVFDEDSTPDTDITNDPLVDTDDVNIDQIPGDEDDHDRALLDPAKVRSDNPRGGTIPGTGGNSQPLLFGAAGLLGAGALALLVARRRRKAALAA